MYTTQRTDATTHRTLNGTHFSISTLPFRLQHVSTQQLLIQPATFAHPIGTQPGLSAVGCCHLPSHYPPPFTFPLTCSTLARIPPSSRPPSLSADARISIFVCIARGLSLSFLPSRNLAPRSHSKPVPSLPPSASLVTCPSYHHLSSRSASLSPARSHSLTPTLSHSPLPLSCQEIRTGIVLGAATPGCIRPPIPPNPPIPPAIPPIIGEFKPTMPCPPRPRACNNAYTRKSARARTHTHKRYTTIHHYASKWQAHSRTCALRALANIMIVHLRRLVQLRKSMKHPQQQQQT